MDRLFFGQEIDLHYVIIFATDQVTVLEQIHPIVRPTKSEDVFSICIDVFKV